MNRFELLLESLTHPDATACLQAIHLGHGQDLDEIEAAARAGSMDLHLQSLAELDLVVFKNGRWQLTWLGSGVYYWIQQFQWAQATGAELVPEPRDEENGDQVVEGCRDFRPLYCRPGYCWCGLRRSQHVSEVAQIAADYLACVKEKDRRERLWNRSSGTRLQDLYALLDEPQLIALQLVHDMQSYGIRSTELGHLVRPLLEGGGRAVYRLDRQIGEELIQRLSDLALVVADEVGMYWYPSFDGVGVSNWGHQLAKPAPHPEPRPGENGDWVAPLPCDQFRAFLPAPGGCWCGHHRLDHT